MGFNIKNNYGPNIEVNEGGVVNLHQGKDGLWHTVDAEEAEIVEEIKDDNNVTPVIKHPTNTTTVTIDTLPTG